MADWSTVMARPELTLEEKRASWAEQCVRRGKAPFGDEFGKSHAPTTPSTEGQGA